MVSSLSLLLAVRANWLERGIGPRLLLWDRIEPPLSGLIVRPLNPVPHDRTEPGSVQGQVGSALQAMSGAATAQGACGTGQARFATPVGQESSVRGVREGQALSQLSGPLLHTRL